MIKQEETTLKKCALTISIMARPQCEYTFHKNALTYTILTNDGRRSKYYLISLGGFAKP